MRYYCSDTLGTTFCTFAIAFLSNTTRVYRQNNIWTIEYNGLQNRRLETLCNNEKDPRIVQKPGQGGRDLRSEASEIVSRPPPERKRSQRETKCKLDST